MRHKEKRRCSPTDFYSVGAERGRPRTEVRHARSLCIAREGIACTKVVPRSRVLLCIYIDACLSLCWGVLLLAVIPDFLFVVLVESVFLVAARRGCRVVERRRPRTTQGLPSLVVARGWLRVCPGLVPVPGPCVCRARPPAGWSFRCSWLWLFCSSWTSSTSSQFRYLGRFAAVSRVAGTRQVERFAACSFPSWRVASEFF